MNKAFELEHLRNLLMNPELPSGLYLLDTDLTDEEIEEYIIELGCCSYMKESLFSPSRGGSAFELFVVGLSHQCAGNIEISNLRNLLFTSDGAGKDNIIYSLLIQMMKHLCMNGRTIIHVYGELDLTTLTHEDLYKLKESLTHHKDVIIVASKNKGIVKKGCDPLIKTLVFKEQKYKLMENRLDRVHISYKNDYAHEDALKAVIAGLEKNNIAYSIDRYDILYGDCIDKYEEEIGASDRIIMFVIPSYFKSIECMYEMTQMFLNGKVRERIIRLVDIEGIQRNGDGLSEIKDYWQGEKARKAQRMVDEPGGSRFFSMEIRKIDEIIRTLDDLWFFICRDSTGDYKKLIENDAELLIEELKKTLYKVEAKIDEKFVPSGDTQPSVIRKTTLNGEKSVYVENNIGSIIIN